MILKKITAAGINWTRLKNIGEYLYSLCVTPTGRIIAGSNSNYTAGIRYSDDNGINWTQSNKTDGYFDSFRVTPTGRIIASGSSKNLGIWYSDDNGISWTQSSMTNGHFGSFCVTPTGRILASSSGSNTAGIWYSDPEYTSACTKYLDQKGAQEIVTQFKAYCDNLVGGA